MPKCVPCLGAKVKAAIRENIRSHATLALIDSLPECDDEEGLLMCGRKSRPLSPYQQFMSRCMKADKSLRECAGDWKKGNTHAV